MWLTFGVLSHAQTASITNDALGQSSRFTWSICAHSVNKRNNCFQANSYTILISSSQVLIQRTADGTKRNTPILFTHILYIYGFA